MATIIELTCSNCGASMKVTNKSSGRVTCPYCQTESIIDGLVKNAEILAKENINSGISMTLTKKDISNLFYHSFDVSLVFPLDIFDRGRIVKEEHFSVPGYLFFCNGMATYNYEAGVERERVSGASVRSNGTVNLEKHTFVDWTPMSGAASATEAIFAPGTRELSKEISSLYKNFNVNKLVDVEELSFPGDVKPYSFNLPEPVAFNEYAKPIMEKKLLQNAQQSMGSRDYKNLTMGGSHIQRDSTSRVTLGIYKFEYHYDGRNYIFYSNGDGSVAMWDQIPINPIRQEIYMELLATEKKLRSKKTGSFVASILCLFLAPATYGISLIGTALFGFLWGKRKSDRKKQQIKMNEFLTQAQNVRERYQKMGALLEGL